jgi:pimeloyl-ACP methyl ester carboxylesterase
LARDASICNVSTFRDLDYDRSGDGPPVLYGHGMLLSRAAEDRLGLTDLAPVIAAGRTLVRYDARGHGRSPGRPVPGDYEWPRLADDLLALRDDLWGTEPVDAGGASMGGATLLWAAVREPARFRRLFLLIPPTTREARVAVAEGYRAAADYVESQSRSAFVAALRAVPPPEIFADEPALAAFEPDITEPLLPSVLRGAAASDLPDSADLAALTHPTLILAWPADPAHPVSTAEYLRDVLPDARLHVSGTAADVRTWGARVAAFLTG